MRRDPRIKPHVRKGNRVSWRVRERDETGRQIHKTFPTVPLASEFLRQLDERKARAREGLHNNDKGPITYDALCELFLDNYAKKSKAWKEDMLDYSRIRFGGTPIRALESEWIGQWLHRDLDLSPKTKKHILDAMRQVLNFGIEWRYLEHNPCRPRAIGDLGTTISRVNPFQSWKEVEKVATSMFRVADSSLVRLICSTGLRLEEAFGLEPRDIDFENQTLHIHRVWVKGELEAAGKTEGALRSVTLSAEAIRALKDIPWPLRPDQPIFTTPTGKRYNLNNWRRRQWADGLAFAARDLFPDDLEARERFKRPPYQMRHTFATLALAQGCTLEWIAEQMGHKDIRTTRKHYARFTKVVHDEMRRRLDGLGKSVQLLGNSADSQHAP